jgi:hypothetical protein
MVDIFNCGIWFVAIILSIAGSACAQEDISFPKHNLSMGAHISLGQGSSLSYFYVPKNRFGIGVSAEFMMFPNQIEYHIPFYLTTHFLLGKRKKSRIELGTGYGRLEVLDAGINENLVSGWGWRYALFKTAYYYRFHHLELGLNIALRDECLCYEVVIRFHLLQPLGDYSNSPVK